MVAARDNYGGGDNAGGVGPSYGCVPPLNNFTWCDQTKSASERALAIAQSLNVTELVSQMDGDMNAIPRLGIPAYHYGYEALHGG